MLKFLRVSVSALALSAFVVAPIAVVATADYAYAKNGNGNGGGNGNGNGGDKGNGDNKGGGDKGNSKNASKGGKGWGSDKAHKGNKSKSAKSGKSKNGKGLGRAVQDEFKSLSRNLKKNGIGGLFKGQTKQRTVAKTAKVSVTESVRPPSKAKRFKDDPMHPRNLGKMNGLLNSSPNAKLAHIANGQYAKGTGPVSLAAALAVADYQAKHLQEDYAMRYDDVTVEDALQDAIDTIHLDEAYQVLDDNEALDEENQLDRDAAEAILGAGDADPASEEYQQAQSFVDALDKVEEAEAGLEEGEKDARPDEDRIADAQDLLNAEVNVEEAEAGVLSTYKGDLDLADEDKLLEAAREALPDSDDVGTALGKLDEEDEDVTIDAAVDDTPSVEEIEDETVASNG